MQSGGGGRRFRYPPAETGAGGAASQVEGMFLALVMHFVFVMAGIGFDALIYSLGFFGMLLVGVVVEMTMNCEHFVCVC